MEHTHINNLHTKVRCMGKNLYGKYLDTVRNIGLYLTVFVVHGVEVYTIYHFKANFSPPSTWR